MGWRALGAGGGQRVVGKMATGEERLSGRIGLLTADKSEYLWVAAQSSCLPQESLSRWDKMQVGNTIFQITVEGKARGKSLDA